MFQIQIMTMLFLLHIYILFIFLELEHSLGFPSDTLSVPCPALNS